MKAIKCEMCNSSDVVKQYGYFVCQSCGTKYSDEEAKKLMIEGTVDVQGTVKVDNSSFVEKYLQNARRAMAKEDWDEVEKYYNMVEQNDPSNIEAIFYSAYGKAKNSLISDDIYKRQSVFKSLTMSVSIIDDNYDISKEAELRDVLTNMTKDVINMFDSSFVYTKTKNGYGAVTGYNKSETYQLFIDLAKEMFTTIGNIIEKFPEEKRKDITYIYRLKLSVAEILSTTSFVADGTRSIWSKNATATAKEISKYDLAFDVSKYEEAQAKAEKTAGDSFFFGCMGTLAIICGIIALFVWIIRG